MTTTITPPPAADGSAATRSIRRRIYPLEWLRAFAALSVVTFHAYQYNRVGPEGAWPLEGTAHQLLKGTDLFVDMFFVLSAFVLWLPIAQATLAGDEGRPGRVLLFRRMARLLPLYLTVVLVVWALTNHTLPGHWQDLLLHLTFTHVYSDEYIFWTNGPAWSLAVEFHFYVLMALSVPLMRRAVRRADDRARRIAALLALPAASAVAGLAYLGYQIHVAQPDVTTYSVWFNPLAKAPDFAIGMVLAVIAAAGVRVPQPARPWLAGSGVAAMVLLMVTRPGETLVANWWHALFSAALAAALASIVLHEGPYPRWMSWRPLAFLGGLGYGIYLIHEPVMRVLGHIGVLPEQGPGLTFLLTALMVAVPTVALAWVSSRTVEATGLKVLGVITRTGKPRDYYAHMPQRYFRG